MLVIDYRSRDRRACIAWQHTDQNLTWVKLVTRLLADRADDVTYDGPCTASCPWWSFVSLRPELLAIFNGYGVVFGRDISLSDDARELLEKGRRSTTSYADAIRGGAADETAVIGTLLSKGFGKTRRPTSQQIRNITKIAELSAAATFSVPGAGKTTEALGYFFYKATDQDRLLVVAPKNAFAGWEEQLSECMPDLDESFVRLRGGEDKIIELLRGRPRFALITYQQLARIPQIVAAFMAEHRPHMFLDESHRIKSGMLKQTARAVLSLAHLPARKLVMSGTPMPQSIEDLVPQFTFLYPEIAASSHNVADLVKPVYVRTTKQELGLEPPRILLVQLDMAVSQRKLYDLMRYEVARQAAQAGGLFNAKLLRRLGRSVSTLLQFVSNPSLLSSQIASIDKRLLSDAVAEGDGPKIDYLLKRVRSLAAKGKKVIVWSSFVRNVEYIAARLADVGAVYIHGGVDAGDEEDDETREGRIRLFHNDPNVRVIVANPAAASEGISLHTVCHHAIYLDRTFNAAHYLQSQDRIHRLGLSPGQQTTIEVLECRHSIDETVRFRLNSKIAMMSEALDDRSLRPDPIPMDPLKIDNYEDYSVGLMADDISALAADLSAPTQ